MGIWDKLKGEFIDIIQWTDDTQDTMVYRFERYGNQIKNGAKLTVRESQAAVFVSEGQIADVFGPGMYTLETQNLPILSTLKGWKYGFNSPFVAEVYFVNTKRFTNLKWGTMNPLMMRDPDFGIVRVRAFGTYEMRVKDPAKFLKEIVGTDGDFTSDEISTQIRNVIVSNFSTVIGEANVPVLDLVGKYQTLGQTLVSRIQPSIDNYGIELAGLYIENVSVPPEVEEAIDKRSSMGVVGNLNNFTQFQMAQSMEKAAENEGGAAGGGMGLGMGMLMMNQMNQQPQAPQQGGSTPPPVPGGYHVAVNGQSTGPFDMATLAAKITAGEITADTLVWRAGMQGWGRAGDAADLKGYFTQTPPPIPPQ
jgi:membrane protease subunit (stomatin/prohibitin family)